MKLKRREVVSPTVENEIKKKRGGKPKRLEAQKRL